MQDYLLSNLLYISSHTNKTTEICSPLFQTLPVQTFIYKRVYNDGRHFMLCTCNKKYVYDYLNLVKRNEYGKFLHNFIKQSQLNRFSYAIYPEKNNFDCVITLNHQARLSKYAISLCYRDNNNFAETFSYFIELNNTIENFNFILNYLETFKQFSNYFLNLSNKIFNKNNKSGIITPRIKANIKFIEMDNETNKIKLDVQIKKQLQSYGFKSNNITNLTKKELQVANELLKGSYTAKNIARNLYISPRTVEHHLAHLKLKLNCCNKMDLISFFKNYNKP